jgi:hypothetical protein
MPKTSCIQRKPPDVTSVGVASFVLETMCPPKPRFVAFA